MASAPCWWPRLATKTTSFRVHLWFIVTYGRHLVDGLGSLGNPIGTPGDKIKVGIFRLKSLLGSLDDLLAAPETTILQRLKVRLMFFEGGTAWLFSRLEQAG